MIFMKDADLLHVTDWETVGAHRGVKCKGDQTDWHVACWVSASMPRQHLSKGELFWPSQKDAVEALQQRFADHKAAGNKLQGEIYQLLNLRKK